MHSGLYVQDPGNLWGLLERALACAMLEAAAQRLSRHAQGQYWSQGDVHSGLSMHDTGNLWGLHERAVACATLEAAAQRLRAARGAVLALLPPGEAAGVEAFYARTVGAAGDHCSQMCSLTGPSLLPSCMLCTEDFMEEMMPGELRELSVLAFFAQKWLQRADPCRSATGLRDDVVMHQSPDIHSSECYHTAPSWAQGM